VLFAPYGAGRYSSGTMPTSYGFTGQRADAVSGLDYYGSRYYDPQAGQFTSGDSVLPGGGLDPWGLSRYAYVEGNPVNRIDPDGHINLMVGDDGSAVPIENAFSGTYSWGGSPVTYHRGFIRSYPASRSIARARTPARPVSAARAAADQSAGDDAQAVLQSNLNRANSITTAQLLSSTRDNWSSLDDDTTAALAWLSGGGSPDRWCQSTKCRNGMQSALQYVDDVWSLLLLAITARSLAFDVAKATGGTLTAHTKGYTVGIDYGSRGIVVRLMKEGGGRTNYYRVSVPGKAAYTVMGDVSTDPARTHIPIEESSLKDITGIVKRIKEG